MTKANYIVLAVFLAFVMIAGIVIAADAQNKTLVTGNVTDSNGKLLEGVKVTVTCGGNTQTDYSDDSGYVALFNSTQCGVNDDVIIEAKKSGYKTKETSVTVDSCIDSSGSYCSDDSSGTIYNFAVQEIELTQETTTTRSGGSSPRKVVKNTTIVSVPKSNVTSEAEIANVTEPEIVGNQTQEEVTEEGTTSGITGAVIGAIKGNAGFVALIFIAAVLVAYMFVLRKRRNAYY